MHIIYFLTYYVIPLHTLTVCHDDIFKQLTTNLHHFTVPIISLSADSFTIEEGELTEIVIMRSGDPGIEVNITLQVAEVIRANNQFNQCTFWHSMLTVNDNAC